MKTIKLMADYQCYPLWKVGVENAGDIDPDSLPISSDLRKKIMSWADEYDNTLNSDAPERSGFPSEEAFNKFRTDGLALAVELQTELGTGVLVTTKI